MWRRLTAAVSAAGLLCSVGACSSADGQKSAAGAATTSSPGVSAGDPSSDYAANPAAEWTPTPADDTSPTVTVGPEAAPVAQDDGYAAAVARFGADQVQAVVADDVLIARTALADCQRRMTGVLSPEISNRLDPQFLAVAQQQLTRPTGYPPALLSDLPVDDGNGHNLAAAVAGGCDDSAPLRFTNGPLQVSAEDDRLVVVGSFAMTVTFGTLTVGAGQDWILTSNLTEDGWRLVNAIPSANTNWYPVA